MRSSDCLRPETRERLRIRGWYPERRVDLSGVQRELERLEMPLNTPAREFLEEFHGLGFLVGVGGLRGQFSANPIGMMTDLLYPEYAPYVQRCHPQPLCPIGYGGGLCLFAAMNGEVVWLDEQFRYFAFSPSIKMTLQNIFEGGSPDSVGPWIWVPEEEAPDVEYFADRPPLVTPALPRPPLWNRAPGLPSGSAAPGAAADGGGM